MGRDWLKKPSVKIVLNQRCRNGRVANGSDSGNHTAFAKSLCLHEPKRLPISIHKRFFPYRWLTCCSRVSSHLPPVSFMSSESHLRSKRRDGVLAGLGAAIPILSTVKDACGFPPAQIALSSACTLLTIIKVHSLLFFNEELPIHVYSGHHEQQTRLSRSRTVLR